jgi:hypothetical protein
MNAYVHPRVRRFAGLNSLQLERADADALAIIATCPRQRAPKRRILSPFPDVVGPGNCVVEP